MQIRLPVGVHQETSLVPQTSCSALMKGKSFEGASEAHVLVDQALANQIVNTRKYAKL